MILFIYKGTTRLSRSCPSSTTPTPLRGPRCHSWLTATSTRRSASHIFIPSPPITLQYEMLIVFSRRYINLLSHVRFSHWSGTQTDCFGDIFFPNNFFKLKKQDFVNAANCYEQLTMYYPDVEDYKIYYAQALYQV